MSSNDSVSMLDGALARIGELATRIPRDGMAPHDAADLDEIGTVAAQTQASLHDIEGGAAA